MVDEKMHLAMRKDVLHAFEEAAKRPEPEVSRKMFFAS